MKKIILSFFSLLIFAETFSQATSPAMSKDYYLQKSKNQKTTAWILLGTGTALIGVGLIDGLKTTNDLGNAGGIWVVALPAGIVADIVSIPFFTSANKNKKRAASVAINNQSIYFPLQNNFAVRVQPAIVLKIGL